MFQLREVLMILFLAAVAECGAVPQRGAPQGDCPSRCHCEEDGMLQRVDCSDLGLTALPANLSVFTSYLDLSMNNLTLLPSSALSNLHFLEELRLAGNDLTFIPKGAFAGLFNLKVLMLQNNQLRQVPGEALQNLRNLQSLRLDANHISSVPQGCFSGLASLRHLWLDDNALTEVPGEALGSLATLQAMTLALNRITHIPDRAFANLSSLVVLHLNNNRISSLGTQSFQGLHNLETLDLNYNSLEEFPIAIRALSHLKELFFYDNPIQFVGRSAFQHLPELRTLSLNGAAEITEFPDLTGTMSLESLTITGARITSLPSNVCDQLPNLQVLDLSYNRIRALPSFRGCEKIQKIDLHHNEIQEVQQDTFQGLTSLRSLDLAWNKLNLLDQLAFTSLPALAKLDLTSNQLSSLPVSGLHGLTHLKLAGNPDLQDLLAADSLPKLRVMELPYAFQCCAFVSCEKPAGPWDREDGTGKEEFARRDAILTNQEDHDLEDFLLDFDDEPKSHHSVQCSPAPGPFRPCHHLFSSWLIRGGVWLIAALSLVCNSLVMVSIFLSPSFLSPAKLLIGLLALVNGMMGLWSGALATVDALTFGAFARYGARWESSAACRVTGFMSVFASETGLFLLTAAVLERGLSVRRGKAGSAAAAAPGEGRGSLGTARLAAGLCFLLGLAVTLLPLLADYGVSSVCLPVPDAEPSSLGFMVALVLVNSLCYLIMTVTYTRLYCRLEKGEPEDLGDGSMIRHVAWLLFNNCLLYFPVAFLSFSTLLRLPSVGPLVVKAVLLLVVPLPACLNPLLYLLFNPHCREDLATLGTRTRGALRRARRRSGRDSPGSEEDAEKQSCDSTQALVTFGGAAGEEEEEEVVVEGDGLRGKTGSQMTNGGSGAASEPHPRHQPSVAFVPCR